MRVKRTQAERSAGTRELLLQAARRLFAESGYAGAGTEAILADTGLTRGALYHHFRDKAALFQAVCEQIQEEIGAEIEASAMEAGNSWDALAAGCDAFLMAAARPDIQQILFVDAPSVLGWEEWARLDREHGFGLLAAGVKDAIRAGYLTRQPAEPLAVLLNGALNDGVAWAARNPGKGNEVRAAFRRLLMGLRVKV